MIDPDKGIPEGERPGYELRRVEDVKTWSWEKRHSEFNRIYVRYPRLNYVEDLLRQAHDSTRSGGEPRCAFISGPAGVGKTQLCIRYAARFPRRVEEGRTVVPVLRFSMPSSASNPGSVASEILKQLGDPHYAKGTIPNRTSRAQDLVRKCGVELIILDEFHHLINQETHHILVTASEWLKELINNTGVAVAAFGMASGERVLNFRLNPHDEESQLGSRFAIRYCFQPFGWREGKHRDEFCKFLRHIDLALPLAKRSSLDDPDLAGPIHYATGGLARRVSQLLSRAMELAFYDGREEITKKYLRQAFEDRIKPGHPARKNPFGANFSDELAQAWLQEERQYWEQQASGSRRRGKVSISDILSAT